ncbi:hypothetical protein [Butyrivibrio sp. FCS014]|uniref:hypothetical protein n=1 Tax=Butyrivibrio sp. FCS014 TaxID=1408304 RepID=UPI0004648C60|nr:hypothetical protein [Butyrivibrio sp. FCS014]
MAILVPRKIRKRNFLNMEAIPSHVQKVIGDKIEGGNISLMYVDEVKGIEFDRVFVVPRKMSKNEKYIAYTRALSNLIIVVDEDQRRPK